MQFKSLKIYCDIVRRRSFSRAANENGISQSSASQMVHQIEERLGLQLLDRSKRPFILTPEGERFYDGCRKLVKQYEELEEEVRILHDDSARRLVIASIYSVGLAPMSKFTQRFSKSHPHAQVRLDYMHPDRVYEVVEQGEVDLGIVSYPEDSRTLQSIPWRRESLVVVAPPGHWLEGHASVPLEELCEEPFVAFEPGLRIRAEIDRALLVKRTEVDVRLEFDNVETIKRAIEIGEGIGILPEPTIERELTANSLICVPLAETLLERPIGFIHRRDRKLNSVGSEFLAMLLKDAEFAVHTATGQTNGTFHPAVQSAS